MIASATATSLPSGHGGVISKMVDLTLMRNAIVRYRPMLLGSGPHPPEQGHQNMGRTLAINPGSV